MPSVLVQEGWPDPASCGADPDSPMAGTRDGNIDGLAAKDGRVRLFVSGSDADGNPCGVVVIGEGEAPAPATSAGEKYPPGVESPRLKGQLSPALPGQPYSVLRASASGARVTFEIALTEVMKSWCPLQTSHENEFAASGYSCLPNASYAGEGEMCLVSGSLAASMSQCDYCILAVGTCACDADHCTANPDENLLSFDLQFDGTAADGLVGDATAHLSRVQ
jgi:hypothetical protein